jgi:hypothetical protein
VAGYGGANGSLFDRVKSLVPRESWCIFDLPQLEPIIKQKCKDVSRVSFNGSWCDIKDYNIFVSFSTLQYVLDSSINNFFNTVSVS